MAKQSDVYTAFILGALVIGGFLFIGGGDFLGDVTGPGEEAPGEHVREGTSATVSVAAFDRAADTSTQVAATNYGWKDNGDRIYLGSNSGASDSRSDYSNLVVGDSYESVAFDDTYDYGVSKSGEVDSESELANLDVWTGAGTGDLTAAVYYDGSSTTDVSTLGSEETLALDYLQLKLDASNKAYSPGVVAFKLPSGTNISSVDMPSAEKVSVPESLSTDYDYAFRLDSIDLNGESVSVPSEEPAMSEWDVMKTGRVVFEADSDGTTGESVTIAYLDNAPFIDTADELAYGVEDDTSSPSDVGVGVKTDTLTV